jgi:hypothetical protein
VKLPLVAILLSATPLLAQESYLQAQFREEFYKIERHCVSFSLPACAETFLTEGPIRAIMGSFAPQNGFGGGLAFIHTIAPLPNWRLTTDVSARASGNGSWDAGALLKIIYFRRPPIRIIPGKPPVSAGRLKALRPPSLPVFNVYARSTSLRSLDYYGIGPGTTSAARAGYGLRETIAGLDATLPVAVIPFLNVALLGEVNGRFAALDAHSSSAPHLDQLYTPATPPGLSNQPGYLQFGEGIRVAPLVLWNHLQIDYRAVLRQFLAPGNARYSFSRLTLDLGHDFPLYQEGHRVLVPERNPSTRPKSPRPVVEYTAPDQCPPDTNKGCSAPPGGDFAQMQDQLRNGGDPPPPPSPPPLADHPSLSRNLSGTIGLRLLVTESIAAAGHTVPFYYQPTLGGSDLAGNPMLPSYADYRFRAPNTILLRGSFEHSLFWKPLSFVFLFDEAKTALVRSDINIEHLRHSFGAGLNFNPGPGLPRISFLFAWGGNEGTHTIVRANPYAGGAASGGN